MRRAILAIVAACVLLLAVACPSEWVAEGKPIERIMITATPTPVPTIDPAQLEARALALTHATPDPTPAPTPVVSRPASSSMQRVAQIPHAPVGEVQAFAAEQLAKRGLGNHFGALRQLWHEESGWNARALGPVVNGKRACGIPQRYPCNGLIDWPANTQVLWGLDYIVGRYGTPSAALAHKHSHGWY